MTSPRTTTAAAALPQALAAGSGSEDAETTPAVTKDPAVQPTFSGQVPPGTAPGAQMQVRLTARAAAAPADRCRT